jgi:transposase
MDLRQVRVNDRGTGSPQYPPRMLLALLLYCYATGVFSSRRIEQAALDSVPVRMICGDTHPDHDTICTFRRENKALLQETFVRVLELAQALKFLQVGQITVAVDGTKVLANASKHAAVSYEHAGKTIQQLDLEVKELLAKAEQADSTPLEDGLDHSRRKSAAARAQSQIGKRRGRRSKRAPRPGRRRRWLNTSQAGGAGGQKDRGKKPRGPDPKAPSQNPSPVTNITSPTRRAAL